MIELLVSASVPVLLFSGFVYKLANVRAVIVFPSSRVKNWQVCSHFSCQRSGSEALVPFSD